MCGISFDRILKYLAQDELQPYVRTVDPSTVGEGKEALSIRMVEATLGWAKTVPSEESPAKDSQAVVSYRGLPTSEGEGEGLSQEESVSHRATHTLQRVNLAIPRGSLVAVVGSVGSGKSSLLNALLGELNLVSGEVQLSGSVAYCEQRPWITNDTVIGNILLGLPLDEAKLDHAIYAASLDEDIKVLPGGLHTQIGEKGVNLSGGQRARVAFARAVYADKDIYLLDDPLSAVDAHVGQFLFRETIHSLLKTKTRLLVTHQLQYLPFCDHILSLKDGAVAFFGTYDEFVRSGELSAVAEKTQSDASKTSESETAASGEEISETDESSPKPSRDRLRSWDEIREEMTHKAAALAGDRKKDARSSTITTVEERDEGVIDARVYLSYITAGGPLIALTVLLLMAISQLLNMAGLFWLSAWGDSNNPRDGNTNTEEENIFYLNVLAVIYAIGLVATATGIIIHVSHRLGASLSLSTTLLKSILNAPMSFFDSTPVGRILNRFSADTQMVDDFLGDNVYFMTSAALVVLSSLLAIAIATKGTFLILLCPVLAVFVYITQYFRALNISLARYYIPSSYLPPSTLLPSSFPPSSYLPPSSPLLPPSTLTPSSLLSSPSSLYTHSSPLLPPFTLTPSFLPPLLPPSLTPCSSISTS